MDVAVDVDEMVVVPVDNEAVLIAEGIAADTDVVEVLVCSNCDGCWLSKLEAVSFISFKFIFERLSPSLFANDDGCRGVGEVLKF